MLPSRFEPWGVVLQEAAASGQAVICTSTCGGASRLVLDGYNGRVVAPDEADELASAMTLGGHGRPASTAAAMSGAAPSWPTSTRPTRWAEHLTDRCHELLPEKVPGWRPAADRA